MGRSGKKDDYLVVGKVTRPRGLRGEVKVLPITDDPYRYNDLKAVYVRIGGTLKKILVESASVNGTQVFIKLNSFDSVEEAESLRGKLLFVPRKNAVKLDRDSYYYFDLLGCSVKTPDGEVIGKVYDILNAGSCDVYCVRSMGENRKEYLVPAVRDVVKEIDMGEKKIVIEPIEGLF